MSCGNRLFPAVFLLTAAMSLAGAWAVPAYAQAVKVVARFSPEAGNISDAAMLGDSHLALLYPEAGRIADYSLDGELHQHIVREAGVEARFVPTFCDAAADGSLLVFDEAAHKVFTIGHDGNITRGVDLAYPSDTGGGALALSRIGGLCHSPEGVIWALLTDRNELAGFDNEGKLVARLDLEAMLPYSMPVYARAQIASDGSLFLLDYHQGAVIFRPGRDGAFSRLTLGVPEGLDAAPVVQDFAADPQMNVVLATHDEKQPLVLLTRGAGRFESHALRIDLPPGEHRLACRYSRGKYILWLRDQPLVLVLEIS